MISVERIAGIVIMPARPAGRVVIRTRHRLHGQVVCPAPLRQWRLLTALYIVTDSFHAFPALQTHLTHPHTLHPCSPILARVANFLGPAPLLHLHLVPFAGGWSS